MQVSEHRLFSHRELIMFSGKLRVNAFFLFSQRNLIKKGHFQNFTFLFVKMEIHSGDLNSRYSTFPCATPKTQGTFSRHAATSYPINDTENTPPKASGARIPNKPLRGRDARREPIAPDRHSPAAARCGTPWPAEGARSRPGRAAAPGPHNLSKFGRRVQAPRSARLLASAPARLQPDLPAALSVRAGSEAPSQPPHRGWRGAAPFPSRLGRGPFRLAATFHPDWPQLRG